MNDNAPGLGIAYPHYIPRTHYVNRVNDAPWRIGHIGWILIMIDGVSAIGDRIGFIAIIISIRVQVIAAARQPEGRCRERRHASEQSARSPAPAAAMITATVKATACFPPMPAVQVMP
jgi:hypothetical protein